MLLFKVILFITIALIVLGVVSDREDWDALIVISAGALGILGIIISLFMGMAILGENSSSYINETIINKTIEYNGLVRELELVEAGDENFDKAIVYKKVLAYNEYVTNYKENAYDRWFSGLYNKEIADNLQLIDF